MRSRLRSGGCVSYPGPGASQGHWSRDRNTALDQASGPWCCHKHFRGHCCCTQRFSSCGCLLQGFPSTLEASLSPASQCDPPADSWGLWAAGGCGGALRKAWPWEQRGCTHCASCLPACLSVCLPAGLPQGSWGWCAWAAAVSCHLSGRRPNFLISC